VFLIDVAAADELLVATDELDHGSCRLGHASAAERIPEHPRMT